MKKHQLLLLFISLTLLISCTKDSSPKEGYLISGSLTGISDGYAYLQQPSPEGLITLDSVEISDGKYNFEGSVDMPQVYYLKINNSNYYITFFLENSSINITSHIDSLYKSKITGSVCQLELDEFQEKILPYKNKLKELYKAYYKAEKSNDEELMASIDTEYEQVHSEQIMKMKDYAVTNPTSVVASYISARYLSNELDYSSLDSIYQTFKVNLENDRYLKKLEERLEILEKVAIGKPAVDIIQNDTSHVTVALSSLKGKNVLIEFWASWCTTCKSENRRLKKIYKNYQNKGFEVFAVSLDNDFTQWTEAVNASELPWINVSDLKGWQSETRKLYGVIKTPHNLLLNKDGIIIAKDLYGEELEKHLDRLN